MSAESAPLKVVFAGTPEFAAVALDALLATRHRVLAVLTQPDRPAGRGRRLVASPVKQRALAAGIEVLQPETLRDEDIRQRLAALAPDVMVVVAYGLIVPPVVLALPRLGCINIHGSLLPRWRGAAPIQRAIEAGDEETGVGIMKMEAGLDTGPVLLERRTPISAIDTGGTLHDRLAALGAEALVEALEDLPALLAAARPQPEEGVTYAHKLDRDDARLDWTLPAVVLARKVRAFNPWPAAWTLLDDEPVKVLGAEPVEHGPALPPGTIAAAADEGLLVACGTDGTERLRLTVMQLPGKRALPVADILRGQRDRLAPGRRFR